FPAHKSMFASANLSRQFEGFSGNVNTYYGQSLQGTRFTSDQTSLVLEKDPIRTGLVPGKLFFGFTANQARISSDYVTTSQQSIGARMRYVGDPIRIGNGLLNFSYQVSQLSGHNVSQGISQ